MISEVLDQLEPACVAGHGGKWLRFGKQRVVA